VPFVVEAWVGEGELHEGEVEDTTLVACVNRTPVTGDINAGRDGRDIDAFGCGLAHTIAKAPKEKQFVIWINVTTPYMPITSDGKAPDLKPFLQEIKIAVEKAVKKAHRPNSVGGKKTQKDVVLSNLETAIAEASGGYQFNVRQVFYVLRPIVMEETGKELQTPNFNGIFTDYEAEHGEIPKMYREPRGTIYHPHRGETIPLGTLTVANYQRPVWTYNKIVYIEKEGASEALKELRWPERHDCMLMSSKGFTTRAARDLIDQLAEHDEDVWVFTAHDADAFGTMIHQTFEQETKARGARKIKIINLGLDPWEALEMGLQVEVVPAGERHKPVADYVRARTDRAPTGETWEKWLQTHRVELNVMSTPAFVRWLDRKLAPYVGKLIPPAEVLTAELDHRIEDKVREAVAERILREAGFEDQVAAAVAAIDKPSADELARGIGKLFRREQDREWRDHIGAVASLKVQS
jgi:hypothetical protein